MGLPLASRPALSSTSPSCRHIDFELPRCQRHFCTTYDNGVAPGTATDAGIDGGLQYYYNTSLVAHSFRFPVAMRVAPTISTWDGAGTASKTSVLSAGSWTDGQTGLTSIVSSTKGFIGDATGLTCLFVHYTASAELMGA